MNPGQALREARLKRGLDLYEVKRVTKISVPDLRAMEENRWEELPKPRAEEQLAAYADFLGLDHVALPEESHRDRAPRRRAGSLLLVGLAAVVLIIFALLGLPPFSGPGGPNGGGQTTSIVVQEPPTTTSAPVSVQISTHALVWVCLVDQRGHALVNGLNLVRDQTIGPYEGKGFDVAFGNGKVDLTVNGQPVDVPDIAAPFGYRITPAGATRLQPAEEPTCT